MQRHARERAGGWQCYANLTQPIKHEESHIYVIGGLGGPYKEKVWPRSQFFPIRTDPKAANDVFIFFFLPQTGLQVFYKWVCLRNFAIESAYAPSTVQTIRKKFNEQTSE